MAFELSPGVEIRERDLTLIIPAVATTAGAFVGSFAWGPADQRILVDGETNLRNLFGQPAADDAYGASVGINAPAVDFFTAAEFLGYGNNLQVVRILGEGAQNANSADSDPFEAIIQITNEDDYENENFTPASGNFIAKYPGDLGNSLMVSICDGFGGSTSGERVYRFVGNEFLAGSFGDVPAPNPFAPLGTSGISAQVNAINTADSGFKLLSKAKYAENFFEIYVQGTGSNFDDGLDEISPTGDLFIHFGPDIVMKIAKDRLGRFQAFESAPGSLFQGTAYNVWKYRDEFEDNPGTTEYARSLDGINDEMHIAIVDKDGKWTGNPGSVLERFAFVSKAKGAIKFDGTSNYYVDVLRENSAYVWAGDTGFQTDAASAPESFNRMAQNVDFGSLGARDFVLSSGGLGAMPTASDIALGYTTHFGDAESVDIQLIIGNGATAESDAKTIADRIIDIAVDRRDCIAFVSPPLVDVVGSSPLNDLIDFRNTLTSTSYAVISSSWKQITDPYNNTLRYIPLTGDIAGLCVRTDRLAEAWFSPAGLNRGRIRNVVKLPFNPTQIQRDRLYSAGINPVVTFPGEGTVLYGDKTMLSRPSAFDRINVRRLFIILEKAIAKASKYLLFELNTELTRLTFRNAVEPFLRDVQARQGLVDFRVDVSTRVNTPTVIDANQFRCSIYLKPTRSINFILLDFIATPTGVSFDEVISAGG